MKELLPDIERWRARGERFALATVVATRRSAPRPIGCGSSSSPGASASSGIPGPVPAMVSFNGSSFGPVLIFSLS